MYRYGKGEIVAACTDLGKGEIVAACTVMGNVKWLKHLQK
jgi:hypothetical protein